MLPGALRSRLGAARAVAVLVAVAAIGWLMLGAFQPLRLNWGDPWSDANVLTTLEYSAKYGFWKTSFTDVLDIGPLTAESYRYTHYPPLAEIFYGMVRKVVGKADVGVYRVFAIAFSGAALYAVHAYVSRVFGALAGACTVVFFASNALFLQYADSIHQAPILAVTSFGALAAVARFLEQGRKKDLFVVCALTFLSFMTAYDFYFFLPLAGLGTSLLYGKRLFSKTTLTIAAAIAIGGVIAIILKSLFIIGALGWHEFKEDFIFQFFERATAKYTPEYKLGLAKVVAARLVLYMTPVFFVLFAAHVAIGWRTLRSKAPRDWRSSPAAPLVLLVAGLPFLVIFSQLTASQVLAMQCIVPYYAIGFGVVAARLLESDVRWQRSLAIATGVVLVGWQVVHIATFKKSFLHDEDRKKVAAFLDEQDKNDFVCTNLLADGPIQAYFQRHLHPMAEDPRWAIGQYRTLLGRIPNDRMHAVFFEDPNTRYIDKSLFPLLVRESRWAAIGAPPFYKATAFEAISVYDEKLRVILRLVATPKLRAGDLTVYSIGWEEMIAFMRGSGELREPTKRLDFGQGYSDAFKLQGMRGVEPGKPYSWSIPRGNARTVLTKIGVIWRAGPTSQKEASFLLNMPRGSDYKVTVRAFSHLPGQALGASMGEHVLIAPQPLGEPWKGGELSFVVPKEALGEDPLQTLRFQYTLSSKTAGAFVVDGEIPDVGVAFQSMDIEKLDAIVDPPR